MAAPPEPVISGSSARRKILQTAVSCVCLEAGFDSVEEMALETLTEMMQSILTEMGQSSRQYCELAGRVEPIIGDVVMAMVSMGISQTSIEAYAQRSGRHQLPTPALGTATKQTGILQTGQKRPHPSNIPDHLPPFPDSHAYIQTPTHKQPVNDYETIREKASCQKRDVERALTRFVAKTGEHTQSFFLTEDNNFYPLIACRPMEKPYICALIPRDQIFEEDEAAVHMQKQEELLRQANAEAIKLNQEKEANGENNDPNNPNNASLNDSNLEPYIIENPFTRAVKMPHSKKKRTSP